jgi:hypothetical protein
MSLETGMKRTTCALSISVFIIVLGLLPGSMTTPCALADSFNVKTGSWEVTTTGVATGMMIPPEMLDKMPPERRAKFEEAMRARSGQPQTHASKRCITQKDLDQNNLIKEEGEKDVDCTTKIVSQSPSKLVLERTCPAPHASTSQISVQAKTPESVVASVDRTIEGSGKMHADIKGHWLGASCDDIKGRQ